MIRGAGFEFPGCQWNKTRFEGPRKAIRRAMTRTLRERGSVCARFTASARWPVRN